MQYIVGGKINEYEVDNRYQGIRHFAYLCQSIRKLSGDAGSLATFLSLSTVIS